jgi:mannose/cellobiose epimerase-like protein (N-acyl-D-glucosamine 2-epimerase family)
VLALLAAGHDGDAGRPDEELATAAMRLVDRMVRDAHHRQLLGASEDEDEG